MEDRSGSFRSKKRVATQAELAAGFRPPAIGPAEKLDVPPDRTSEPSFKVKASWIPNILGPIIGAAFATGVIYMATLSRIEALESRDVEITTRLESVATEALVRSESTNVRVYAIERDQAVIETEHRATTRAMEAMAEELKEIRLALQRLRR